MHTYVPGPKAKSQQTPFNAAVRKSPSGRSACNNKSATNELPGQCHENVNKAENKTGMPDQLKAGLESLSGLDLSSIRVHSNSPKPAEVNAFAYTQGRDIFHEGWHAVQRKLKLNTPGDKYEQEADRIADQVMMMPVSGKTAHSPIAIQRVASGVSSQRSAETDSSSTVQNVLRSPGNALPEATRAFMEPRFGHDFSHVRVHTNKHAEESARALDATAYTAGSNIVFGSRRYQPVSTAGRQLLAHELTHVLQQSTNSISPANSQVIQRQEVTSGSEVATSPTLTNARFTGNRVLEQILSGRIPALSSAHNGRRGAVSKVQQALVALGFELPMHRADGSFGSETTDAIRQFRARHGPSEGDQLDGPTLAVLDRVAPVPGVQQSHTVDYDHLLADGRLDVTVALGATDETVSRETSPGSYESTSRPVEDLEAERFRAWMTSHGFTFELFGWAGNEDWKATRSISWTGADGTQHTREVNIWINLVVPAAGAAREFRQGLSRDEITIYSGHARYGSGPDFDAKSNAAENFRMGIDRAMSAAGRRTRVDEARRHGVAIDEEHDLVDMVNSGNFNADRYRVLFFNACTSLAYLDEIREQVGGTQNVDVVATRRPSMFTTRESGVSVTEIQRFLEGILAAESVESVIAGLDDAQRQMHQGSGHRFPSEGIFSSSGMGDNPLAP
jgi:hypothetical protein